MSLGILGIRHLWVRYRRRPRVYGPAVAAGPLVTVPFLVGFFAGAKGAAIAFGIGYLLTVVYVVVALRGLGRFVPVPRYDNRSWGMHLWRVARWPMGMVLLMTIAVGLMSAAIAGLRPTPPTAADWTQTLLVSLLFGVLGGLAWWEIFFGQEARKGQRRHARSHQRVV
jgi:hypothetical protein